MAQFSTRDGTSRWARGRWIAAGVGLGATLALSPLVWAENPTASTDAAAGAPAMVLPHESFAPLVKRVLPAVVNISVTESVKSDETSSEQLPEGLQNSPFDEFLRRFFEQQQGNNREFSQRRHFFGSPEEEHGVKRIALGSGFIVDAQGHIVTNSHVVAESSKVQVTLQDNSKYDAKLVGRDARTDLAVLKIDAGKPLPYVSFGDSGAAEIGDWVVAVGNPFGLGGSVTTGIISARGRDIHEGQFDDFLQIDAPINRGNSGGPTFNLNGEVIGINTAIYSPNGGSVGIGFAVPSNVAKRVISELEASGKVTRGWLGVQVQPVTSAIASSLNLKGDQGALVAVVSPDSPSAKAGLKQGDVILSFNGNEVSQMRDLPRLVAATSPGTKANLTVWRNGDKVPVDVTIGELPQNPRMAAAADDGDRGDSTGNAAAMGLHFAELSGDLRRQLHVNREVRGVVITHVDDGSIGDNIGLTAGDVIVSIDQRAVRSPQEAADRLSQIAKSPQKTALLLLDRHGVTQYVGVTLGKDAG
jgi:serine protease Do